MNGLIKLFTSAIGIAFVVSAVLALFRWGGPNAYICRTKGEKERTRTVCLGLVEFRGDDILSIYRIRPIVGKDRDR